MERCHSSFLILASTFASLHTPMDWKACRRFGSRHVP